MAGSPLPAGGYLVAASAGVTNIALDALTVPLGSAIQNGDPDGIALFNTVTNTLVDALSYGGQITAAKINFAPGTYNLVEGTPAAAKDSSSSPGSLSRCPDGSDTDDANTDWKFTPMVSPGDANSCL
jgi:hypothetical protein